MPQLTYIKNSAYNYWPYKFGRGERPNSRSNRNTNTIGNPFVPKNPMAHRTQSSPGTAEFNNQE
jgi:hypothetical protein